MCLLPSRTLLLTLDRRAGIAGLNPWHFHQRQKGECGSNCCDLGASDFPAVSKELMAVAKTLRPDGDGAWKHARGLPTLKNDDGGGAAGARGLGGGPRRAGGSEGWRFSREDPSTTFNYLAVGAWRTRTDLRPASLSLDPLG